MKRTFKPGYFTIAATGTAQPLAGTAVTAAVAPSLQPVNVTVASSAIFELMDWVKLVDPSTSPITEETLQVIKIPDSTHVTLSKVQGEGVANAYTTSSFVQLSLSINNVYIETKAGNTGIIFVGSNPAVSSSTGAYGITAIGFVPAGVAPTWFSSAETMGNNPDASGDYWVVGTSGDKYMVTLGRT